MDSETMLNTSKINLPQIRFSSVPTGYIWGTDAVEYEGVKQPEVLCDEEPENLYIRDVMWYLMKGAPLPVGYFSNMKFGEKVENNEWWELIEEYDKINTLVIFFLVLGGLLTLVGIIAHFCYAFGLCGFYQEPSCDRKYDKLMRFYLNIILIIFLIVLCWGTKEASVSNFRLHRTLWKINKDAGHWRTNMQDNFFDITKAQTDVALRKNSRELTSTVEVVMRELLDRFKREWQRVTGNMKLDRYKQFEKANETIKYIDKTLQTLDDISYSASELLDGLRYIKRYLVIAEMECKKKPDADCDHFDMTITAMELDEKSLNHGLVNHWKKCLKDFRTLILLLGGRFFKAITKDIVLLEERINKTIKQYPPEAMSIINSYGFEFKKYAREFDEALYKINLNLHSDLGRADREEDLDIHLTVPKHVVYLGSLTCVILALVSDCFTLLRDSVVSKPYKGLWYFKIVD